MKIEIITTKKPCKSCREVKAYFESIKKNYTEQFIEDMPSYIKTWEFRNNPGLPHVWVDGKFRFHGMYPKNVLNDMFVKGRVGVSKNKVVRGRG
jgi:glutaredoxin